MYKIEHKEYGFKLTLYKNMSEQESKELLQITKDTITANPQKFCCLVDVTDIEIFPATVKSVIIEQQKFCIANGLVRSSVLVRDNITKMQLSLVAKETGLDKVEHYFSTEEFGYEQKAIDWILYGNSPKPNAFTTTT